MHEAMSDIIPISLLGGGWIVEQVYLPLMEQVTRLRVVSIFDPDRERAERVANSRIRVADDPEDCLASGAAGCIICSPPGRHFEALRIAARTALPTLCEKPVVRAPEELEALGSTDSLFWLMGSSSMRARRDVRRLLDWIHEGQVGQLRSLRLEWSRQNGVPAPGSWRTRLIDSPTGVLEDLGPHLLDIAMEMLMGPAGKGIELRSVQARMECLGAARPTSSRHAEWYGHATESAYDAPDDCSVSYVTRHGIEVELNVKWIDDHAGDYVCIRAEGELGSACLEGLLGLSVNRRVPLQRCSLNGRSKSHIDYEPGPGMQKEAFRSMLERFARFCAGDDTPMSNVTEALAVAKWIESARKPTIAGPS